MKLLRSFTDMIDKGGLSAVFVHIRNLFYCSLIIAAGSYAHAHPSEWAQRIYAEQLFGYPIMAVGVVLMLLNLADGIYKLSKLKHPVLLSFLITVFYLFIAIRLVVLTAAFRMR